MLKEGEEKDPHLGFWPGNPDQKLMGPSTSDPFLMRYPSTCTMGMAIRVSMILSNSMYYWTIDTTCASHDNWKQFANFQQYYLS